MGTYDDNDVNYVPYASAVPVPPPALPARSQPSFKLSRAPSKRMGADDLSELQSQGFTKGMATALFSYTNVVFPLRIWVIDNSGSMNTADGTRVLETANRNVVKMVSCTRWKEIQETVTYHAQMAGLLGAHTVFRMLNDPGSIVGPSVFAVADAESTNTVRTEVENAVRIVSKASPSGVTPLTSHIREIRNQISEPGMLSALKQKGQKVAIILATDGMPTSEQGIGGAEEARIFTNALRSLEGLPVWVVVRLCTNDDNVVDFYNNLDAQLEMSIEVLDDFVSEAREVHSHNKWLNYALSLHRCREMGYHDKLFDLLDERQLTKGEVRDFCCLLFGEDTMTSVPDPEADWDTFIKRLERVVSNEAQQWDPIKKKVSPWISIHSLKSQFGEPGCNCM